MALAALELAEHYRDEGHMQLARWGAVALVALMVPAAIYAAARGHALDAVLSALIALGHVGHLLLNPATQPKRVTRSLEASRRMLGAT